MVKIETINDLVTLHNEFVADLKKDGHEASIEFFVEVILTCDTEYQINHQTLLTEFLTQHLKGK